jgi:hypothetical protein
VSDDDTVWNGKARSGHPTDVCPECGTPGCIFASDFKKMGPHKIRACAACGKVTDKGGPVSDLDVFKPPEVA